MQWKQLAPNERRPPASASDGTTACAHRTGLGRAARLTRAAQRGIFDREPESRRRAVLSSSRSAPDGGAAALGQNNTMPAVIDCMPTSSPGIDDGPASIEESVALAEAASQDGLRTLALTPHCVMTTRGFCRMSSAHVAKHGRAAGRRVLRRRARDGGELDLVWAQRASPEELLLVSYKQAGSDLLVETPYGELPYQFRAELAPTGAGISAAARTSERNPTCGRSRPAAPVGGTRRLVKLTAASLAGPRRFEVATSRSAAIQGGIAHVIASDAHGEATVSAPAFRRRSRRFGRGPTRPEWMVTEVPAAILAGRRYRRPRHIERRQWAGACARF